MVMDPRVTLLPDFISNIVDSRWFTGVGWALEEGKKAAMLTSRIEPMQQAAPACMVIRLRGGVKLVLPSPEDIPTLPSLTILINSLSAIKDHTMARYCLETLAIPNQVSSSDEEHHDPSLLPDRWYIALEDLKIQLSSLDSSATTSPDTPNIDIISIGRLDSSISLDLYAKKRGRASSFKRQHSIDSMLAVQRSSFNRVNPDIEDLSLLPSPGLDMSYVTRAVEGTSYNISVDVGVIIVSGDILALVAGSQLVLHCIKSVVLTSDTVTQMLTADSKITANSMSRLSEVATIVAEDIAERPLAAMTMRLRVTDFMLAVPSTCSQQAAVAVTIGLFQVQIGLKQNEISPDELEIDTLVALVGDAILSTPEQDDHALIVLKSAHGFAHVDWPNKHGIGELDSDGLACIADSKKLVEIVSLLARRWGTARVSVVGCDRTNCLYGDEVSLLDFINSPMLYFDMLGEKGLAEDGGVEEELTVPLAPVSDTLTALLPLIGMELNARLGGAEVQLPPSVGSDKWTVVRLNEVVGSIELDSPNIKVCRSVAVAGAVTLAVCHGAPEVTQDGEEEWTGFSSADSQDEDVQLISPFRVDGSLHIPDTDITMASILDGVALKCNMQPVLDQGPLGDYSLEMEKGSNDRLSVHETTSPLRSSLRGVEEDGGANIALDSPPKPPQRKSVPLRRVSMTTSSTLSLRLALGTMTRLQTLLDDQMKALEQLLSVLVTHGWLPPETTATSATLSTVTMDLSNVAGSQAVIPIKGRESQVADDLVALGKTMQEARAAADALGEELRSRALERQEKRREEMLRVGGSLESKSMISEGSLTSGPSALPSSPSLSSIHDQSLHESSSHGDGSSHGPTFTEKSDNDDWALERLRGIQGLLSTAQNLQEHTKSSMSAQVSITYFSLSIVRNFLYFMFSLMYFFI